MAIFKAVRQADVAFDSDSPDGVPDRMADIYSIKTPVVVVIDAGSNSFRLAAYECAGNSYHPLNEVKSNPELAKGTYKGNRALDSHRMQQAESVLEDFGKIIQDYIEEDRDVTVHALGTAAIRSVQHTQVGRDFLHKAEQKLGHTIQVITGRREALLTGMGLLYENPKARGVFAGIGGGSIELGAINKQGRVINPSVIDEGALSIHEEFKRGRNPRDVLFEALEQTDYKKGKTLRITGGDWRAVARVVSGRIHGIEVSREFPHGLTLSADKILEELGGFGQITLAELTAMPTRVAERAGRLWTSAEALRVIVEYLEPKEVIFSNASIREGVLYARIAGYDVTRLTSHPVKQEQSSSPARVVPVPRASKQAPNFRTARAASPVRLAR